MCWRFQTLNFHFFILCLKCPPNFSCRDARREDGERNTLTEVKCKAVRGEEVGRGEGECCEVRRVLQLWWWWWGYNGALCESLLSNGAYSHQHRPHWVCGARVY